MSIEHSSASESVTAKPLPKLRAVEPHPVIHGGQPALLLHDPLELSEKMVIISRELAPLLALCDGTRDIDGLRASMAIRYGLRVAPAALEKLLTVLDESLLLENERSIQAQQQALEAYRRAPSRSPASAGRSYPAEAEALRQQLEGYLGAASEAASGPGICGRICGLVSPHIDYERGGPAYAAVWKAAAEAARAADLVILLGTDHLGAGLLSLTRQHYSTPYGVLPTAREIVDTLAQAIGQEQAFASELVHRREHSVELAAIWLQHVRGEKPCEVVPILCGSFTDFVAGEADPAQDPAIEALAETLQPVMAERRTLVVAAADLAHVGPAFGGEPQGLVERAQLRAVDAELIELICAGDAAGFFAAVQRAGDRYNVCGLPPIYAALRILGPVQGEQVAYDRCPADQHDTSLVSICGIVFSSGTREA